VKPPFEKGNFEMKTTSTAAAGRLVELIALSQKSPADLDPRAPSAAAPDPSINDLDLSGTMEG
jgi:hypothetical protein